MTDSIFHKPTVIKPQWHYCKNSAEIELLFDSDLYRKRECPILLTIEWETKWDAAFTTAYGELRKFEGGRELYDSLRESSSSSNVFGAAMALVVYEDAAELMYQDPDSILLMALLGVPSAILLYPACVFMN